MTYLFIFAHPDDETVACAATMKQLIDAGDEVIVISATDGSAGEVHKRAQSDFKKFGSVGELRRHELKQVSELLRVTKLHILDFTDGKITNEEVWGKLKEAIMDLIEQYKPVGIITFDHSGWYFHLDHVGVSIATTLAFQQSMHRPEFLLFSYMKVEGSKWKYVYPEKLPITHVVLCAEHRDLKISALKLHASQDMKLIHDKVQTEKDHSEIYQLVSATKKGEQMLKKHPVFHTV